MGLTAGATPPAGPPRAVDGRPVLAAALVLGLVVWRTGPAGVAVDAAICGAIVAAAGRGVRGTLALAARHAGIALAWGGVRAVAGLAGGAHWPRALEDGGTLSLRLLALLLLGAAVTSLLTPRALGVAAASLARPVLGARAWEAALALSLMIHAMPRALARYQGARAALRARRVKVSRLRAARLVLEAGTRNLAVGTWDQTLAIAARRLDRPGAWAAEGPPRGRELAAAAAVALAAIALAAA